MRAVRRTAGFLSVALVLVTCLGAQNAPRRGGPPQQQFQEALSHYQSGQYALAAGELEALALKIPPSFQVDELLGLVYSAEGKDEQASRVLQEAVRLNPASAAARANLAVNLARLGKSSQAEAEFKQAVKAEPDNFEANHDFGEFYARAGRMGRAIPYLARAQHLRPSSYENGYDLALAYEQNGQLEEARRQIQELLRTGETAELHDLLAEVDERSGDYLASAKEYQQAAHLDPSEQNIFDWGSEYLLHHTWNPAVEIFSQGVERYPNSVPFAVGLGLALYWRGDYDEAVKALLRATDLAPSDPHTYYFLSNAYERAPGEASEIIARFRRFEDLCPNDTRAAYYYAMSLWKFKGAENSDVVLPQVVSLLEKAARLDPSYADVHLQLGKLYSEQREYSEAVPEYNRAVQLDPKLIEAHYLLGQAYVHLGKKELAEKEFALHQKLYARHLAEDNQERERIRQFVYSIRGSQKDGRSQ